MIFIMKCKQECCDDSYIGMASDFQRAYNNLYYKSITPKCRSYDTIVSQCIRYHGSMEAFVFYQLSTSNDLRLKKYLVGKYEPSLNIQFKPRKVKPPSKKFMKEIKTFIDDQTNNWSNEMIELISDKKLIEHMYIK